MTSTDSTYKVAGWVDQIPLSALKRGLRAAAITFIAYPLGVWFGLGGHEASGVIDAFRDTYDTAAGYALITGLGAAGWRFLLDPLPVPTLSDANRDRSASTSGDPLR